MIYELLNYCAMYLILYFINFYSFTSSKLVLLSLTEHDYLDCFLGDKSVNEIVAIHNVLDHIYTESKRKDISYSEWGLLCMGRYVI